MATPHKNLIHSEMITSNETAPWLSMVHGFSHNHNYFNAQTQVFQKGFRLFQVDLRGHGGSVGMPGPFGIEEYTDDVVAALDAAGIEKTHYWGTHTGAAIGLVLALRHPDRLASLVLEGTMLLGFPMPRLYKLLDRARSIANTQGAHTAAVDWFENTEWFSYIRMHPEQCRAEEHRQMVYAFQGEAWLSPLPSRQVTPVSNFLTQIHIPALVYNGVEDMPDFRHAADHLAACLPNVRYENVSNAGCFPAWENPGAVNALVHEFLSQLI